LVLDEAIPTPDQAAALPKPTSRWVAPPYSILVGVGLLMENHHSTLALGGGAAPNPVCPQGFLQVSATGGRGASGCLYSAAQTTAKLGIELEVFPFRRLGWRWLRWLGISTRVSLLPAGEREAATSLPSRATAPAAQSGASFSSHAEVALSWGNAHSLSAQHPAIALGAFVRLLYGNRQTTAGRCTEQPGGEALSGALSDSCGGQALAVASEYVALGLGSRLVLHEGRFVALASVLSIDYHFVLRAERRLLIDRSMVAADSKAMRLPDPSLKQTSRISEFRLELTGLDLSFGRRLHLRATVFYERYRCYFEGPSPATTPDRFSSPLRSTAPSASSRLADGADEYIGAGLTLLGSL
jgi:hypothetical protein